MKSRDVCLSLAVIGGIAALTFSVRADATGLFERILKAEDLEASGKYALAEELLTAVISSASNTLYECHAKARLAACLRGAKEYERAISLCDEVATRWPICSSRFRPLFVKGDCLAALGRTNEAVRAYQEHCMHLVQGKPLTHEDLQKHAMVAFSMAV